MHHLLHWPWMKERGDGRVHDAYSHELFVHVVVLSNRIGIRLGWKLGTFCCELRNVIYPFLLHRLPRVSHLSCFDPYFIFFYLTYISKLISLSRSVETSAPFVHELRCICYIPKYQLLILPRDSI